MHALALALFAIWLPQAEVKEIHGRVVDGDGKPVAGATIAAFWTIKDGAWTPGGPVLATTDDQGAFAKKVLWSGQSTAYFAISQDGTRGGIVVLDDASVGNAQAIRLAPLAAVEVTFDFDRCGAVVPLLFSLMARPARTFVGQVQTTAAKQLLRLPPGDYAVRTFARDAETLDASFTVPADTASVAVGPLAITPSVIARHYGKEPPALDVTDARGVGVDFRLADLKGKWVLIDFWGHW